MKKLLLFLLLVKICYADLSNPNVSIFDSSGNSISSTTGSLNVTDATSQSILNTIATNTGAQATDTIATGTISALNGAVSVNAQGAYTVTALISGTWVGTLVAEGLLANGSTWQQLPMYVIQTSLPYPSTFTVTTNATVAITGGGYTSIRIRASAYTSGTASISLDASLAQQTIFTSQLGAWSVNQGTAGTSPWATIVNDTLTTGTLGSLNAVVNASINDVSSAYALIGGTWVGTIQFQGSVDNSTYVPLLAVQGGPTNAYTTAGFTANGGVRLAIPAGFKYVQAKMTAYTSGSANITLNTSAGLSNAESIQLNAANFNAQVVGNVASGTADSGNGLKTAAVVNTTVPTFSNGQRSDTQADTTGSLYINQEGRKATYSASTSFTIASTATDIFTIYGSATKTVRITRIALSGIQTTASTGAFQLIKRSSANTGGTTASVTAVPFDSNSTAATATVLAYTANPTGLGTSVGTLLWFTKEIVTSAFANSDYSPFVIDYANRPSQAIVLRGTSQGLAIDASGGTFSGNTIRASFEWTEE